MMMKEEEEEKEGRWTPYPVYWTRGEEVESKIMYNCSIYLIIIYSFAVVEGGEGHAAKNVFNKRECAIKFIRGRVVVLQPA